jgi:hypothetical protein
MDEIEKPEQQDITLVPKKNTSDGIAITSRVLSLVSGTALVGVSIYGALTNSIEGGTIGIMLTAAASMFTIALPKNFKE